MMSRAHHVAWAGVATLAWATIAGSAPASPVLPAEQLDAAVDSAPETAIALSQLQEARAQARIERSSAQGWLARGVSQSRNVTGERDFREWEMSVEHSLRLPGKSRLDRSVGESEISRAEAALADARRTIALAVLNDWYQCVAASARHARAAEDLKSVAELEWSVARRQAIGEAAQVETTLAGAERAAVQAGLAAAAGELRSAQDRLMARGVDAGCGVDLPPDIPSLAPAQADAIRDPAVRVATEAANLARLRASRARAERWADPSIGVRYAQERAGLERIVGVFVSVPLPSRRLAAEADRAAAMARRAEAELSQVERQAALRGEELRARQRTARARWKPLDESARMQSAVAQQMWRAYTLGETDLATALIAQRTARLARGLAQDGAVDVWHTDALVESYFGP